MASPQGSNKSASVMKVTQYDFDPDVDTAVDVAWVDMRDFTKIMIVFFRTVGTSAIDTFEILANSAADGTGTDVEIKVHAVANEPNAVGDYIFLECTVEEINQEAGDNSTTARYVSASLEFATSTDEGVVTYIRHGARFPQDGLTVELIA